MQQVHDAIRDACVRARSGRVALDDAAHIERVARIAEHAIAEARRLCREPWGSHEAVTNYLRAGEVAAREAIELTMRARQ